MTRILGTVLQGVAILYGVTLAVVGFLVAQVERIDPLTGIHSDGLGRILQEGPGLFHAVGSPGSRWEFIDAAVFFTSLVIIVTVFNAGAKYKGSAQGATT